MWLFSSGKWQSRLIVLSHDLLAIPFAWFGAYWFRFSPGAIPPDIFHHCLKILPFLITIQLAANFWFGLYRGIWRFASIPDLIRIIKAVGVSTALVALGTAFLTQFIQTPRSVFLLYGVLLIIFLGGSRLFYRWSKYHATHYSSAKRVLIIGAGQAGEGLIRDLLRDTTQNYKPVAILDDDRTKKGMEIHGVRVIGKIRHIIEVAADYKVDLIFLALPSASSATMRHIVSLCEKTHCPFRTLPGIKDLASGNVSVNALRQVSIEDLLGREPVSLDWNSITKELSGKVVLVSGGGGSIGSELCRQVARLNPAALIIIENSEFNLYKLNYEMQEKFPSLMYYGVLADITDQVAVSKILKEYAPEIIFHAAAYKHVPLLENQVRVAVKNNIIGTWILAQQAVAHKVKKFTLISTDKAVNPTNVMGTTKRIAEILCQNFNQRAAARFTTVRFGNVLDSAGSVIPLFRQQIAQGGPVTVTHPQISRFFMTIPEAAQLILQATVMDKSGKIFVLDMGEPIKISYLAEQMIQLAGLKVEEDIKIEFTGLRPGEKLYEELFHEGESLTSTLHRKILQAEYRLHDWQKLSQLMNEIIAACDSDETELTRLLKVFVPEYSSPHICQREHEKVEAT